MPFEKGHTLNQGRIKDSATKAAIGRKNGMMIKCPYCEMISTRSRISKHIEIKHPLQLQYVNFTQFYIETLFVGAEEYETYLQNEAIKKIMKASFKEF